jgi:hypothetical protein
LTKAQNKKVTDWTLPKMVIQAKLEEKAQREKEENMLKLQALQNSQKEK